MFGANYLGQPYYGQGSAIYLPPVTKSLSVTVTLTPTIGRSLISHKMLNVTVHLTASILRQLNKRITTTVALTSAISSIVTSTLKLIDGATKFLNPERYTISAIISDADAYFQADYFQNDYFQIGVFSVLGGTATYTKNLTLEATTVKIEE